MSAVEDGANGGTRRAIIDTAARLFRERGFSDTTTRELGDAVGIRGPSIYHHFETKQDLLFGVCRESLRRLDEAMAQLPADGSPEERIRALIHIHVATIVRDRDLHAAMLIEMRALTGERRGAVIESRDAYERLVRSPIEAAQAEGYIRDDMSPRQLTLFLLGLLNWTIFWFRESGALDAEHLADMLAELFLDGAAATSARTIPPAAFEH
ncbi:MAG TPA: TetR family transcriptional regulator [Baekduia sp.]|nr:TetR family transcriptional regulator [Baekduia sp.]